MFDQFNDGHILGDGSNEGCEEICVFSFGNKSSKCISLVLPDAFLSLEQKLTGQSILCMQISV